MKSAKGGACPGLDHSDSECDCSSLQGCKQRIQWPRKYKETQGERIQLSKMKNNETRTTERAALGGQCQHRGGEAADGKHRGRKDLRDRDQLRRKGEKLYR